MAVTTVQSNNNLVQFTRDINREFIRQNMFSPFMGPGLNAIIRLRQEPKKGGEVMNIPLVTKLTGKGVGRGPLVGNEEKIDNYGMRLWIDWARHAVVSTDAEKHKDDGLVFEEARPMLSDWGRELQRDELVEAFMALPSETSPVAHSSDDGDRVNGIRWEASTATQRNAFGAANSDRILFGNAVSNYNATFATALGNVDTTNDKLTGSSVSLLERIAEQASPSIRPYSLRDGYETYVLFVGTNTYRDLYEDLKTVHMNAQVRGSNNPLFRPGDLEYGNVLIRKVPQISTYVSNVWTDLKTAGNSSSRVEPVFLAGQQAAVLGWGQMAKPVTRKEDDYGFVDGRGISMAYGVGKMFKKHPMDGTSLKQWGVVTGFFSAAAD